MILQALTWYYEDLLQRGEIAAPGWSPAKISFALCLDKDGQVTQVIPTMEEVTMGKNRPASAVNDPAVGGEAHCWHCIQLPVGQLRLSAGR